MSEVVPQCFDAAVPWRRFRAYRGQRHYTGSYWSSTMRAHVGFESRLELSNLRLIDFDPTAEWILSQPFLMEGLDGGVRRRHVPDFLVRRRDGRLCLVDVKPAARLLNETVQASLGWTRRVVEEEGWEYRVCSEPDVIVAANVRFLAGYRREEQFRREVVAAARKALTEPCCFDEAVDVVAACAIDRAAARSLVLHLLWLGWLTTDLSRSLQGSSLVVPA
jgi:hypothetical protein